jgi:hypothetical protein
MGDVGRRELKYARVEQVRVMMVVVVSPLGRGGQSKGREEKGSKGGEEHVEWMEIVE